MSNKTLNKLIEITNYVDINGENIGSHLLLIIDKIQIVKCLVTNRYIIDLKGSDNILMLSKSDDNKITFEYTDDNLKDIIYNLINEYDKVKLYNRLNEKVGGNPYRKIKGTKL